MQESLELPGSDDQNNEINFFVSPNNSLKKPKFNLQHTASQQSLAYSSQTHGRYRNVEASPIVIHTPNFQSTQKPEDMRKMLREGKQKGQILVLQQTQSEQQLMSQRDTKVMGLNRQERNKTMNRNEYHILSSRCKQLEYALNVQLINCEQLRTKVSILTQLLEHKIKDSEIGYFLKLKNSSKNLQNIDIFVAMKQMQKKLKEQQLKIEQQKQEIDQLIQQKKSPSHRKQNVDLSNYDPTVQIEMLTQQKQSLFGYIEQLKKQYKVINQKNKVILEQLTKYEQKQYFYNQVEKPKFTEQLSQQQQTIKQMQTELQTIKMQNNLLQLNYENNLQQLKGSINHKKQSTNVETSILFTKQSIQTQTDFNEQLLILKAQLQILKNERNYYITQYQKKMNDTSQNYLLKLQLKSYKENQKRFTQ